jgi:hypothetical protein
VIPVANDIDVTHRINAKLRVDASGLDLIGEAGKTDW